MAALTLRLNSSAQLAESDTTIADKFGWTVAKNASPLSSEADISVTNRTSFTSNATTAKPSGLITSPANYLQTVNQYSGLFAATAWTMTFGLRATTAAGATRIRCRVYKGTSAATATEVTGSTQVGTTTASMTLNTDVTSVVTWTPSAAFVMNNEFLFVVIALEIVTAGGSNSSNALVRTGTTTTGTRITTSNFTPSTIDTGTERIALTPSGTDLPAKEYTDPGSSANKTIGQEQTAGSNTSVSTGGPAIVYYAQSFIAPENGSATIEASMIKTSSPTTSIPVELWSGTSAPTSLIQAVSVLISSISTSPAFVTIPFSGLNLVAGQTYWLLMRVTAETPPNEVDWLIVSPGVYDSGAFYRYADGALDLYSDGTYDGTFRVTQTFIKEGHVTLTPSGVEQAPIYTDSGTTSLLFTATSSTEQLVHSDSDTISLLLAASAVEQAALQDTGTLSLGIATSAVEGRFSDDSATANVLFTVATVDEVAAYVDSGTSLLAFTPSAQEGRESADSNSSLLSLNADASSEAGSFSDSGTATSIFTVVAAEASEYSDTDLLYFNMLASSDEQYSVVFTDTAVGGLGFIASGTDVVSNIDDASVVLMFTSSATEERVSEDAAVTTISLLPSSEAEFAATDSDSCYLAFTATSAEGVEHSDAGTESLQLLVSADEFAGLVDADEARVTLAPSADELITGATTDIATVSVAIVPSSVEFAVFFDEVTMFVALLPDGIEQYGTSDITTVPIAFDVSASELVLSVDLAFGAIILNPSGSESISGSSEDISEIVLLYAPSGSEVGIFADTGTSRLLFGVSSNDYRVLTDYDTIRVNLFVFSIKETLDAQIGTIIFGVDGTDTHSPALADQAQLYLHLIPTVLEIQILITVTGFAYRRWIANIADPARKSVSYKRYKPSKVGTRYSGTIPFVRWWYSLAGKSSS